MCEEAITETIRSWKKVVWLADRRTPAHMAPDKLLAIRLLAEMELKRLEKQKGKS